MILYFVEPQLYGENVSESYSYEEPKHIVVRGSPTKLEEAYLWKWDYDSNLGEPKLKRWRIRYTRVTREGVYQISHFVVIVKLFI